MPELAYVNGSITPLAEAKVPVTDAGFRRGYGIFETLRGYHGRFFRLESHIDRLRAGARYLGISIDACKIDLAALRLAAESGLTQSRVNIIVTGWQPGAPSVVITAEEYRTASEDDYRRGIPAVVASIRRHSDAAIHRYKTTNLIENVLARTEAESRGAVEAIFLNERGEVAETNRANIFIVRGGVIMTPGLDAGILPGVTRGVVLENAGKLEIGAVEMPFTYDDLRRADEAFITSSMAEVMPLTVIDGVTIGTGGSGEVTGRLRRAYRELVDTETRI